MTQYLPPNLLALFAPRDPIQYMPPLDKLPWEKKRTPYTGVSNLVHLFEDPADTPAPVKVETREERKERKRREKAEQVAYKLEQDLALWDPTGDPNSSGSDPYKSLFIARINYDTTESKLRREFESYGPIRKVHMVYDKISGKPRGYGFIEFEHERDMHSAYKYADGKKIDGKRVLVDVERGRTVKGWRPRRLGGGLGGTRRLAPTDEKKRDDEMSDVGGSRHGSRERERDRSRRDDRRDRDRDRGDRERDSRRRSRERDRPRPDRERDREQRRRSRSRERPRRSRSPRDRKRRSRSRDRIKRERVDRDLPPANGERDQVDAYVKTENDEVPA